MSAAQPAVAVRTADEATWTDLRAVFGDRGAGSRCWCQRYKLAPRESFGSVPPEVRAHRLRQQTDCGHRGAGRTSGLVAYLDAEAVGWCAVEPRPHFTGLTRVFRVPWEGRDEDRGDASVWAVTCLFTRAGFRRLGVSRVLAEAAVRHARGSRAGGLPDHDHAGGRGGAARRYGGDLRPRGTGGREPSDPPSGGDAARLLSAACDIPRRPGTPPGCRSSVDSRPRSE